MKFSIGEKVSLQVPMPYLKTVDTVPMLRPPDLVSLDEVWVIIGIRPKNLLEVKFIMLDIKKIPIIINKYIKYFI